MSATFKRHQARINRLVQRRNAIDEQILELENNPPGCQHCEKDKPLLFVGERSDGRRIMLCSECAP